MPVGKLSYSSKPLTAWPCPAIAARAAWMASSRPPEIPRLPASDPEHRLGAKPANANGAHPPALSKIGFPDIPKTRSCQAPSPCRLRLHERNPIFLRLPNLPTGCRGRVMALSHLTRIGRLANAPPGALQTSLNLAARCFAIARLIFSRVSGN
jgi:hypothetical protein